jgi:uncharacterized BrkB/YihY/UPF0761 family membrane protein
MTWMWLSIIVVLVGAKLNLEIEHWTLRGAEITDTMADRKPEKRSEGRRQS